MSLLRLSDPIGICGNRLTWLGFCGSATFTVYNPFQLGRYTRLPLATGSPNPFERPAENDARKAGFRGSLRSTIAIQTPRRVLAMAYARGPAIVSGPGYPPKPIALAGIGVPAPAISNTSSVPKPPIMLGIPIVAYRNRPSLLTLSRYPSFSIVPSSPGAAGLLMSNVYSVPAPIGG